MRTHIFPSILASLTALSAGCTAAVSDLNSYEEDLAACVMDGNRDVVRDFAFDLSAMGPHSNHYFDILVTDQENDQLRSRFILDPLGPPNRVATDSTPHWDVFYERALPSGNLNIQFYADTNADRTINNPVDQDDTSNDHTWIRPVCSNGSQYFEHIFSFEPIVRFRPIGAGYELHLTNIPEALRSTIAETRLVFAGGGTEDGRIVAVYQKRPPTLGDPPEAIDLVVPGVVDLGNSYAMLWYFDADGDLQPSEGDVFCGRRGVAPDDGADPQPLSLTVDMTTALDDGTCDLTTFDADQVPPL